MKNIGIPHTKYGFTLIELSIVLVIIALIIGGILVGKDLIHISELRRQMADIEKINTAAQTFRNKYNALPGDISGSSAAALGFPIIPGTGQPAVGNGNGFIDGSWPNTLEIDYFWAHLRFTGLISCICNASPSWDADFSPAKTYYPGRLNNTYVSIYGGPVPGGSAPWGGISVIDLPLNYIEWGGGQPQNMTISPADAYYVDSKTDDGYPLAGKVQALGAPSPLMTQDQWWTSRPPSQGTAGSANCVNTGITPNVYNTTNNSPTCAVQTQAAF